MCWLYPNDIPISQWYPHQTSPVAGLPTVLSQRGCSKPVSLCGIGDGLFLFERIIDNVVMCVCDIVLIWWYWWWWCCWWWWWRWSFMAWGLHMNSLFSKSVLLHLVECRSVQQFQLCCPPELALWFPCPPLVRKDRHVAMLGPEGL